MVHFWPSPKPSITRHSRKQDALPDHWPAVGCKLLFGICRTLQVLKFNRISSGLWRLNPSSIRGDRFMLKGMYVLE